MPRCRLDGCPVAQDSRCLEGRGADCPNLIPEAAEIEQVVEPATAKESAPTPTFEPLPSRLPLDIGEARAIARRGPCTVVALAGMPECGKTSLLARLHQMFQSGPVAGFDFAGSRSLPHFEELNWLATVESGVSAPRMPRSSSQFDNSFIHLSVRGVDTQLRMELLLNDITGETFQKAVAAQSDCDALLGLGRADHLVILLDGDALATAATRRLHVEHVRDFLQRVRQSGQCGERTALHIVISKLDKLLGQEAIMARVESELRDHANEAIGSLNFWRTAARPMDGSLPTNEAIAELFAFWVTRTHRYPTPLQPHMPRHFWARDFCRYGS